MPELMHHQSVAVSDCLRNRFRAVFYDTGTGKTLSMLTLLGIITRSRYGRTTALVVSPKRVMPEWVKQNEEHQTGLKIQIVDASRDRPSRARLLGNLAVWPEAGIPDVLLMNFDQVRIHVDHLVELLARGRFTTIIVDESSCIRNTSKTTKAILRLAKHAARLYLLSGVPAPNGIMDYFYQISALEIASSKRKVPAPGVAKFGTSLYRWKLEYFYPDPFVRGVWQPKHGSRERIMSAVQHWSITARKEDCLDLPSQVFERSWVSLSVKELDQYKLFIRKALLRWDDDDGDHEVSAASKLVEIMKARQFLAGIVKTSEGKWVEVGDSKLRVVLEILQETEGQCIIFGQFVAEIERIARAISGHKSFRGKTIGMLTSRVSEDEKQRLIDSFKSGRLSYLIVHERTMSHGLNLQHHCSTTIWASLTYSYDAFKQACDRIHRYGQKDKCVHHLLVAKGTIDEKIAAALEQKRGVSQKDLEELRASCADLF